MYYENLIGQENSINIEWNWHDKCNIYRGLIAFIMSSLKSAQFPSLSFVKCSLREQCLLLQIVYYGMDNIILLILYLILSFSEKSHEQSGKHHWVKGCPQQHIPQEELVFCWRTGWWSLTAWGILCRYW